MIRFGKSGNTQGNDTIITMLTDKRLVKIDPQEEGFFDIVLEFKTIDDEINAFIKAIVEVKAAKLETFYKPIYDPSEAGNMIVYEKGRKPAVGHSYNWWVEIASKMPAVEGRNWHLINELQQYASFVWLINELTKAGLSAREVLNMVVRNSRDLGSYYDSKGLTGSAVLECTGSKGVCGMYDLANTYKILACSKESNGFLLSGGSFYCYGYMHPLASLNHYSYPNKNFQDCVGLLVL